MMNKKKRNKIFAERDRGKWGQNAHNWNRETNENQITAFHQFVAHENSSYVVDIN